MMQRPHHVSRIVSAANSNNATVAKKSAGTLFAVSGYNAAAAVRYLKIYNTPVPAAAPIVGTDTPLLTIAIPPTTAFAIDYSAGIAFSLGIGYALVTGSADSDNTAVTAADIVGLNVIYE